MIWGYHYFRKHPHVYFKSKNLKHKTSPKKAALRYWSSSFGFGMPYIGREPDLCVVKKCCHQMHGQIWWSNPKKSPEKLGKETCTGDWYLGSQCMSVRDRPKKMAPLCFPGKENKQQMYCGKFEGFLRKNFALFGLVIFRDPCMFNLCFCCMSCFKFTGLEQLKLCVFSGDFRWKSQGWGIHRICGEEDATHCKEHNFSFAEGN